MRYRKLRIAWSVVWGVVAVLLICLWGRSYWWIDSAQISITKSQLLIVNFMHGGIGIGDQYNRADPDVSRWTSFEIERIQRMPLMPREVWDGRRINWGHESRMRFTEIYIAIPYWLLVPLAIVLATVSWIPQLRYRFSLRTLLISTTLIAVVLGLMVYVAQT
jgi:hypothetical protein